MTSSVTCSGNAVASTSCVNAAVSAIAPYRTVFGGERALMARATSVEPVKRHRHTGVAVSMAPTLRRRHQMQRALRDAGLMQKLHAS